MLYCSIDEAWGTNKISSLIKNKKKYKKKIIESFTETVKDEKELSEIDCKRIIKHVMKCKKCYRKLQLKFRPKLLGLLHDIIDEYREIIVLVLMGIFLMLFFNLVNNLSNNKKTN